MEKLNMKYYEVTYENLLREYLNATTLEEKNEALENIKKFIAKGREGYVVVEPGKGTDDEYYNYRNTKNYHKVAIAATNDFAYFDNIKDKEKCVKDEIKASKNRRKLRYVKNTLKGVVAAGVVIAIALGVKSCNNKKSNNTSETTTTTTTIESTITTSGTTSTTPSESTSATTTYDKDGAIPSMSKEMEGIKINEPSESSETTRSNNGGSNNGGSNNGGSNNGGSNNGGSNNGGSSSPAATEGTKATEGTPATPTPQPSATTTETNPEVPGTTPVETQHTEPKNPEKQRDITVDVHDGKNPEYIEEDINETYPTYTTFETSPATTKATTAPTTTTTTAAPTTAATTKPNTGTVNGMPVEDDEDETYPTYFDAGQKTNSKAKTLGLRK
ncbi:MAG: hypothetical protein IKP98_01985 [Bacilli bacterium]|nr:hypothetical protein [Bacilli bacterium]